MSFVATRPLVYPLSELQAKSGIRRRTFLGASALSLSNTARADELRADVVLARRIPALAAGQFLTFSRCYAASPDGTGAAAETGVYPHQRAETGLERELRRAGRTLVRLDLADPAKISPNALIAVHEPARCSGLPTGDCERPRLHMRLAGALRAGETESALLSEVDLLPTLLGAFDLPAPPALPGNNLWKRVSTGNGPVSESVYAYGRHGTPEAWRMVVRGFDKLVVDAALRPVGLYNLAVDPEERENRLQETSWRLLRDELLAHLRAWMRRVGDGMDPSSGLKIREGKK